MGKYLKLELVLCDITRPNMLFLSLRKLERTSVPHFTDGEMRLTSSAKQPLSNPFPLLSSLISLCPFLCGAQSYLQ